ncbi:LuxR C-terminal-related transcriptional regulator [Nonomuraea sp. JJY05]|jgi:DNA-binding NarL/FixJ family response regulator|uniref:response regulator transcription factor n=1 Tax=Nonomuraea sp. JJY05 TaxID=3350255 RepID=UPI00373EFA86
MPVFLAGTAVVFVLLSRRSSPILAWTTGVLLPLPMTGLAFVHGVEAQSFWIAVGGDPQGAVRSLEGAEPVGVLMDLHMPGLGGVEATRRIVAALPRVKVLVLTMFDDDESLLAAMRAGARGGPFSELTGREHEVLELIAGGLSDAGIARRLVLSEETVRNHVSNIFAKLHVADRAQAVVKARQAGLGA